MSKVTYTKIIDSHKIFFTTDTTPKKRKLVKWLFPKMFDILQKRKQRTKEAKGHMCSRLYNYQMEERELVLTTKLSCKKIQLYPLVKVV